MSDLKRPLSAKEVDEIFVQAMNEGDLDKAMSIYHEDTVFVQAPGEPTITGLSNLRENLKKFIDIKPDLKVELKQFVQAGDVAFFTVKWQISGTGENGEEISMSSYDGNVVQRQDDGSWRLMIDNPFHAHHIGLLEG